LIAMLAGLSAMPPAPVRLSLVELIANPQRFDGLVVDTWGYYLAEGTMGLTAATLSISKQDAENVLGNSILVVPTSDMKSNREKLDRMYVEITGTVSVADGGGGTAIVQVNHVKRCVRWSDPGHPRMLMVAPGKYK